MATIRSDLKRCTELETCEAILKGLLTGRKILGTIPLTQEEGRNIRSLLQQALSQEEAMMILRDVAPLTVGFYLVWKGMDVGAEDTYWEAVSSDLLLDDLEKWKGFFQEVFHQLQMDYSLMVFQEERGNFTREILAHSWVAKPELHDFLSHFLLPLFGSRLLFPDLVGEVETVLAEMQEKNLQNQDIIAKKQQVSAQIEELEHQISLYKTLSKRWDLLLEARSIQRQMLTHEDVKFLLPFPEDFLAVREQELQQLGEAMGERDRELDRLTNKFLQCCQGENEERNLKRMEKRMEKLGQSLFLSWQIQLGEAIVKLPLTKLRRILWKHFHPPKGPGVVEYGKEYGFIKKQRPMMKSISFLHLKKNLEDILQGLPFQESFLLDPQLFRFHQLEELQELYLSWCAQKESLNQYRTDMGVKNFLPENREYREDQALLISRMNELEEELEKLRARYGQLQKEVHNYKERLNRISPGVDVSSGLQILKEQRALQEKIYHFLDRIGGQNSRNHLMPLVEGGTRWEVRKCIWKNLSKKRALQEEEAELTGRLISSMGPIYSLQEPVQLFILQGGGEAKAFLVYALLVLKFILEDKIQELELIPLPTHLREGITDWGIDYFEELQTPPPHSVLKTQEQMTHFLQRPYLFFSREKKEISLFLPAQLLAVIPGEEASPSFHICSGNHPQEVNRVNLEYSPVSDRQIRTHPQGVRIPYLQGDYSCEILLHHEVLCSFRVPTQAYYGLDERGRCLEGKKGIPGQEMLAGEDLMVIPHDAVLARQPLSQNGSPFFYLELDCQRIQLLLAGDQGVLYRENVRRSQRIYRIGGNPLPGILCEGEDIYGGVLPDLLICLEPEADLNHLSLQISSGQEARLFSFQELKPLMQWQGNDMILSLQEILGEEYGRIEIVLHETAPRSYQEGMVFYYLPQMQLNVQGVLFPPFSGEGSTGYFTLFLPEDISFQPLGTVTSLQKLPGHYRLSFPLQGPCIWGQISGLGSSGPWEGGVQIALPILEWRLEGMHRDFLQEVVEIWKGEILAAGEVTVQVKLPAGDWGEKGSLILGDQQLEAPVQQGLLQFPLSPFSGFLQDSPQALLEFSLSMKEGAGKEQVLPLFRVRTRWQVFDVRLGQAQERDQRRLWLTWQEKGQTTKLTLLIWNLRLPPSEAPQVVNLTPGKGWVHISRPLSELPLGHYRLQFLPCEPEEGCGSFRPLVGSENTLELTLGSEKERREMIERYGVEIVGVEDEEGNRYPLQERAFLLNMTRDLFDAQRDRYQGQMLLGEKPLPTNPITFYLQVKEELFLLFLEDVEGDGLIYCPICRRIFWELKDIPHQKVHFEPEKILVRINWRRQVKEKRRRG